MSDILTKSIVPGSAPVIRRGTPGTPAYTIDVPTYVPIFGIKPLYDELGHIIGSVYGFLHWKVIDHYIDYPAVPGTPDVVVVPGTADNYNIGWNSGAVSIASKTGDFTLQFSIPFAEVGAVVGVGPAINDGSYQNIPFGIYCASGLYEIYELGIQRTGPAAYATTDVFTIARSGVQIQYFKGSTLIYTSLVASHGTAFASAAMYFGYDAVNNAAFGSITGGFAPVYGTCAGTLKKLTGYSSDSSAFNTVWPGTLRRLTGTAESYNTGSCAGVLRKLTGQAFVFDGATFTEGVLKKLTGFSEDDGVIQPQYAICDGLLPHLGGFSAAVGSSTTSVVGVLSRLHGFSATIAGGFCQGTLGGLRGYSSDTQRAFFNGTLNNGYSLFAQGHQDEDARFGFFGTLSTPYSLHAQGGAQAHMTGPRMTLVASGTTTILGEAYLTLLTRYRLLATGTGVSLGRAYLTLNTRYSMSAQGGAQAHMIGPRMTVSAHGFTGAVGEARLTLHSHYSLTASGTQRNFGIVNGTLSGLRPVNSGSARGTMPRLHVVASGHNLDVTPVYEGYAVAFVDGRQGTEYATTRYATFPFDRIVRFGSSYYGVAVDGLYALGADDFDGDPIISVVESAETDFGDRHQKRPVSLYLGGRMGADIDVSVTSAEVETDTYTYPAVATGSRNNRAKFGKGIKARYLAYGFTNTDGDDWELDELTPELEILRRTA
jgi:hypothetical protein